ncbi:hypothetical protein MB09_11680 [Aequorivita vladivostokensis]|uniref:Uncharacterized protein n=2 Tax=Aequorivita vladivostokensis TaxID=171194 RepID=A0ABR5DGW0_9FLAO|nr:hypothetical protein MB09_11680 [Aequorivita vladivostokensis]
MLSLIMKKHLGNIILVIGLICSQNNFSQDSAEIKILETRDGKTIKLLPNNRVLFEVIEKVNYPDSTNIIGTTEDGREICGVRISAVIHQSYGFYEYDAQNLVLNLTDENPIERLVIRTLEEETNEQKSIIKVSKNFETFYDLSVYQNNKLICLVPPFEENWEFTIETIDSPLVLKYNNHIKTIKLDSYKNTELIISINDLKAENYIKNEKLVYPINQLTEK